VIAPIRTGAVFPASLPVDELPAFARRVELLGFDELWLVEDCFAHGGISAAATVLATVDRIGVGIGLLPAPLRNPGLVAMELGTLASLYPGRLSVAFGHGVEAWMRQLGARPANRITLLRDVADVVRRLLSGEEVTYVSEHVLMDHVSLEQPPSRPPRLLIGTTGERGTATARDLGFGLLVPEGAGPAAVRWARRMIPDDCQITVYAWLSIDQDATSARAHLEPFVREWAAMALYPRLTGFALADADLAIANGPPVAEAIVGTPAECASAVDAIMDAGADAIVFVPATKEPLAMLERFHRDVAPLLAR